MRSFCRHHRQALAGWSCETCRAKLCPQCVAEKMVEKVTVEVCASCGEGVTRLLEHRAETIPYAQRLRSVWRYPLSFGGYVAMGGVGLLCAVGIFDFRFLIVGMAVFWGFMFSLIQSSARGIDDIEPPDFRSLFDSVLLVLLRAILATSASWVPMIAYAWVAKLTLLDALVDPILWVLMVFGLLYAPMVIMGAAVGTPLLRLLNPVWMVRCVGLLGREYWRAVGMLGVLFGVQFAVGWLAVGLARIPIPLLPMLVAFTALMYAPLVMTRVVGLLLFVCGDKLGYGDPQDYYELVVTDRPCGSLPAAPALASYATPAAANDTETGRVIEVDF